MKNVPFQRYKFNKHVQEAGEQYEQYKTALLKQAETCDFETIRRMTFFVTYSLSAYA